VRQRRRSQIRKPFQNVRAGRSNELKDGGERCARFARFLAQIQHDFRKQRRGFERCGLIAPTMVSDAAVCDCKRQGVLWQREIQMASGYRVQRAVYSLLSLRDQVHTLDWDRVRWWTHHLRSLHRCLRLRLGGRIVSKLDLWTAVAILGSDRSAPGEWLMRGGCIEHWRIVNERLFESPSGLPPQSGVLSLGPVCL
jgi:hypothetical protein